jgi:hypothetical protein
MSRASSPRVRGKIREWRSKLALRVGRNKSWLIALAALGVGIIAVLLAVACMLHGATTLVYT